MMTIIELPSGKIIDLNRFVALMPDEKAENEQYHLILEGCAKRIFRSNIDQLILDVDTMPSMYSV
jgi:hypothetical protein